MSKKEKRWRVFYKVMYVFFYGFIIPLSLLLFFMGEEKFPYTLLPVAVGLPLMKSNHIQRIREKEQTY
ncbi:hypothetical protein KUV80_18135 [Fictibacillus nanhaiensis]|uniref:hypothetical protein n=1 Tax=Fictibacillus nanhaiensis TaxID=742169 RepID=UPI001C96AC86|nr:hypothetical protein [Fictibacillus nanhaiensis]MBY6038557.1 hypothetical protein [Fictibacillus nanhaiensis]